MSTERELTTKDLEQRIFRAVAEDDNETVEKLSQMLDAWLGSAGLIIRLFENEDGGIRYESRKKPKIGFTVPERKE